jgi:hypothetical protein
MEASIDTTRSHRDIQPPLRIWPIIKEAIRIPWIRRVQGFFLVMGNQANAVE